MGKRYDLVIVGAGPTGLMAAKVAGENGLRVALVEKKHEIHKIKRACGEVININEYSWGDYINYNSESGLLLFPVNGIAVPYAGPHRNIYGMYTYSPGGNCIAMGTARGARGKGDSLRRGIAVDKGMLLQGLLDEARRYGVEVITGSFIHTVERKKGMVVVGDGSREYEAVFVIAADGLNSKMVQGLGFNRERIFRGTLRCLFWYVRDIEPPAPDVLIHVMGGADAPALFGLCTTHREGEYWLAVDDFSYKTDLAAGAYQVMRKGAFAPWFKKMSKTGTASCVGNLYSPLAEPFKDNVLIAGDAAFSPQISINGGILCGWKAANAVVLALLEGKRNAEGVIRYLDWWKKEILEPFANPAGNFLGCLEDGEVDYLFSLFGEPLPGTLDPTTAGRQMQERMMEVMPRLNREHPELLEKIKSFQSKTSDELYAERQQYGFPNR